MYKINEHNQLVYALTEIINIKDIARLFTELCVNQGLSHAISKLHESQYSIDDTGNRLYLFSDTGDTKIIIDISPSKLESLSLDESDFILNTEFTDNHFPYFREPPILPSNIFVLNLETDLKKETFTVRYEKPVLMMYHEFDKIYGIFFNKENKTTSVHHDGPISAYQFRLSHGIDKISPYNTEGKKLVSIFYLDEKMNDVITLWTRKQGFLY